MAEDRIVINSARNEQLIEPLCDAPRPGSNPVTGCGGISRTGLKQCNISRHSGVGAGTVTANRLKKT
jgi:hypothetical protein